jgi:hypothetical protein
LETVLSSALACQKVPVSQLELVCLKDLAYQSVQVCCLALV